MDSNAIATAFVVVGAAFFSETMAHDMRRMVSASPLAKLSIVFTACLALVVAELPGPEKSPPRSRPSFAVAPASEPNARPTFGSIVSKATMVFMIFLIATRTRIASLGIALALAMVDQVLAAYERSTATWPYLTSEQAGAWRSRVRVGIAVVLVVGFAHFLTLERRARPRSFTVWRAVTDPKTLRVRPAARLR